MSSLALYLTVGCIYGLLLNVALWPLSFTKLNYPAAEIMMNLVKWLIFFGILSHVLVN
jgi:hypothetical protein